MKCCLGCGRDTPARHGYCTRCCGDSMNRGSGKSRGISQRDISLNEFFTYMEASSDEMNIREYEKLRNF